MPVKLEARPVVSTEDGLERLVAALDPSASLRSEGPSTTCKGELSNRAARRTLLPPSSHSIEKKLQALQESEYPELIQSDDQVIPYYKASCTFQLSPLSVFLGTQLIRVLAQFKPFRPMSFLTELDAYPHARAFVIAYIAF